MEKECQMYQNNETLQAMVEQRVQSGFKQVQSNKKLQGLEIF